MNIPGARDTAPHMRYISFQGEFTEHEERVMAEEHKHGEMDIEVQEKTFDGFIKATTYSVVAIFIFLVLLAMFAS